MNYANLLAIAFAEAQAGFDEGHTDQLKEAGVNLIDMNDSQCIALMRSFIEQSPQIWLEDIGECYST